MRRGSVIIIIVTICHKMVKVSHANVNDSCKRPLMLKMLLPLEQQRQQQQQANGQNVDYHDNNHHNDDENYDNEENEGKSVTTAINNS